MLRIYNYQDNRLSLCDEVPAGTPQPAPIWLDLVNPTIEETRQAEQQIGVKLPSRDEMEEIELSDRLYHEDGAEFMTITVLAQIETQKPIKTAVTFVLKRGSLITVRYAEPKPFRAFLVRSQRPGMISTSTGELTMLGIIEAVVDRLADTLERVGDEIDSLSAEIFQNQAANATKKTRNLQLVIERIGKQGDLLGMARESLVSIARMVAYHTSLEPPAKGNGHGIAAAAAMAAAGTDAAARMEAVGAVSKSTLREVKGRLKLIQRDVASLAEHAAFLTQKTSFLLDATLGVINLEQNQIIKIFSVAAVVFLPPTLVASIYGMNFDLMPELHTEFGYPLALLLMVVSAILPYLYFKRRGWL